MNFESLIFVFLGGGLGSVIRFFFAQIFQSPFSTLIVNVIGSFLIGPLFHIIKTDLVSLRFFLLQVYLEVLQPFQLFL